MNRGVQAGRGRVSRRESADLKPSTACPIDLYLLYGYEREVKSVKSLSFVLEMRLKL